MGEEIKQWLLYLIAPFIGILGWVIRKVMYAVDEKQVRQIVDDKLSQIKEQTKAIEDKYGVLSGRLENIEDKVDKTYDRVDNIYELIIKDDKKKK